MLFVIPWAVVKCLFENIQCVSADWRVGWRGAHLSRLGGEPSPVGNGHVASECESGSGVSGQHQ